MVEELIRTEDIKMEAMSIRTRFGQSGGTILFYPWTGKGIVHDLKKITTAPDPHPDKISEIFSNTPIKK